MNLNRGIWFIITFLIALPQFAFAAIVKINDFQSKFVISRDITIYLPENYGEYKGKFNVIYMHDGENLFEPSKSLSHADWGADNTIEALIKTGKVPPAIIVGISSTPLRGREYLPQKFFDLQPEKYKKIHEKVWNGTPMSDQYLKFIVKELKPYIDVNFNVFTDRKHTFIMGSSMGGLISLYAQMEYPKVFGASASLSMHWLLSFPDERQDPEFIEAVTDSVMKYLKSAKYSPNFNRVYIDYGDQTLDEFYPPFASSFKAKFDTSYKPKSDRFEFLFFTGTEHSEKAWAIRLDIPMKFLLNGN